MAMANTGYKRTGVRGLFDLYLGFLAGAGVVCRTGVIVDASFVEVLRQRNRREENEVVKRGEDAGSQLVVDYAVTDTSAHDLRALPGLVGSCGVFGLPRNPHGSITYEFKDLGVSLDAPANTACKAICSAINSPKRQGTSFYSWRKTGVILVEKKGKNGKRSRDAESQSHVCEYGWRISDRGCRIRMGPAARWFSMLFWQSPQMAR